MSWKKAPLVERKAEEAAPKPAEALPWWHPSVVPGQAWNDQRRQQRMTDAMKWREELERAGSADPRIVDPPKHRD